MTNALAPQNSSFPTAQEFQTMKEMGAMAVRSGFLPTTIKTPEQACIIMMKGRELGIPPMQAFSSIAVVNGKPTMSAELMLSMIYKNVAGAVVNFLKTDSNVCEIEAKRPGGKATTFSFSMEDAKRANLTGKGPWVTYPAAMLRARCVSAMARAMFPDALSGVVYTAEELGAEVNEEGEIVRDVTPENDPDPTKQAVPKPSRPEAKPATATHASASDQRLEGIVNKSSISAKEIEPGEYTIRFGRKYKDVKIKDIDPAELESYITWLERSAVHDGTTLSFHVKELKRYAELYRAGEGIMTADDKLNAKADAWTLEEIPDFKAGAK